MSGIACAIAVYLSRLALVHRSIYELAPRIHACRKSPRFQRGPPRFQRGPARANQFHEVLRRQRTINPGTLKKKVFTDISDINSRNTVFTARQKCQKQQKKKMFTARKH